MNRARHLLAACFLLLAGCSHREQPQAKQGIQALPSVLVKQILDDHYSGCLPGRVLNDVKDWSHQSWDLNGDGKADFIIEQEDPYFCGSKGCSTLVYVSTPGGYRCVYSGICVFSECAPLPFKTNKLPDLVFKTITIDKKVYYTILWFDGEEYQEDYPNGSEMGDMLSDLKTKGF